MAPAGPAFAPVFAALHPQVFPHEPWDEPSFATLLAQPGVLGFIDPRGGFLLLRQVLDEAEILTIGATQPRRGIASALLREGLAALRARGVTALFLEVAARNAPARALYAGFGFVQAGLRRRYYTDGDDALTLRLEIG
ncbi:GNAT family N-acetyltransferase [Acidocella sp.]|uniref:GNAT family N-acetyltransferase n=1 Tax=Acidocella sp. TaxID=50710 RepID=UPI002623341F|nr:GNAT family N-acetyltransferase [Acidocella sp.]